MSRRSKNKQAACGATPVNRQVPGANFVTLPSTGQIPSQPAGKSQRPTIFFNDPSCPKTGFLTPKHERDFRLGSGFVQEYIIPNRNDEVDGDSQIPGRHKGNTFFSVEHCLMFALECVHRTGAAQGVCDSRSRRTLLNNVFWADGDSIFNADTGRDLICDLLKLALYSKFGDGERRTATKDGAEMVCRLLETGNAELVYADPKDKVLGIGFEAEGATSKEYALSCRGKWGENLLGKFLEQLRDNLRPNEAAWREMKEYQW